MVRHLPAVRLGRALGKILRRPFGPLQVRARRDVPLLGLDHFRDDEVVEVGTPAHFFENPTEERTKLFLSQIL